MALLQTDIPGIESALPHVPEASDNRGSHNASQGQHGAVLESSQSPTAVHNVSQQPQAEHGTPPDPAIAGERDKHLWVSVLLRQFDDLRLDKDSQEFKDAKSYLLGNSTGLHDVCEMAGFCRIRVKRIANEILAEIATKDTARTGTFTYQGETLSIDQWAGRVGVKPHSIWTRLERGHSFERIIKVFAVQKQARDNMRAKLIVDYTHDGKTMNIREWADHLGISHQRIRARLAKGYSHADVFSSKSLPRRKRIQTND